MSNDTPHPIGEEAKSESKPREEIPVPYLGMVADEEDTASEDFDDPEVAIVSTEKEEESPDVIVTGKDDNTDEPESSPSPPPSRKPAWMLLALVPAIILLLFVAHQPIKRSAASLVYPYQLDREEGFILWQAMRIAQNETIYPPVENYPYVVGNYPPIYPMIYGGLMGFSRPTLELGRAVTLLSVLVIIACLVNIIFRETSRLIPAILAVLLFMATWDVNEWIPFARVDFTALALGLLGLLCVTSPWRRTGFALGLLFFTLAFFTKQTQLVAPAAAIVGMLWRREVARAIFFTTLLVILLAGGILLLNSITNGQFFLHAFLYNANEMVPGQLGYWLRHLWFFGLFKFLALAAAIITALVMGFFRHERENHGRHIFPEAVAYLLFAALSIASIAKVGAAVNYLLEFHAAAALFIGLVIGEFANTVKTQDKPGRWKAGFAFAVLTAILVTVHAVDLIRPPFESGPGASRPRYALFTPPPDPMHASAPLRVETQIEEVEGDILAEEPIFNIRTQRPVLYQPFIMTRLAKEGQWEQSDFLHDLEMSRFKLIVANQNLFETPSELVVGFTPEMIETIRRNYNFLSKRGGYFMYVPKNSRVEPVTRVIVYQFGADETGKGVQPTV